MSAPFDPEAVMDALAPLLGLTVPAEARTAVATNLRIAAAMADLVLGHPPGDHAEPAPVFTPLERAARPTATDPDLERDARPTATGSGVAREARP